MAVPLLITFDVHTHVYPLPLIEESFRATREVLGAEGIRATFFVPADSARQMPQLIRDLRAEGHQIGCHGLTHGLEERFDLLPAREQERRLREATAQLEDIVGGPITAFRSPVFRLSGPTLEILDQLGYRADCSVNSQRLGLLGSDPLNVSWLFAPRRPYHPDARNPFRRGTLRLWEIPLSAWLVPFMTSGLQVFRLRAMRQFFRLLHLESRWTGKPIMYLLHTEDLLPRETRAWRPKWTWRHLLPSRDHGFLIRFLFYETDAKLIAAQSRALLHDMQQFPRTASMTVDEYVETLASVPRQELVEACAASPS